MNKNKIKATAFTYWSDDDDCFVTESPLFDRIAGTGETSEESMQMFVDMLDDTYNDVVNGRMRGITKRGRPVKEGVRLNASVPPSVKESLEEVSKEFEISLGDAITVAVGYYVATRGSRPIDQDIAIVRELETHLADLADKLEAFATRIDPFVTEATVRKSAEDFGSLAAILHQASSAPGPRISYQVGASEKVAYLWHRDKQQRKCYAL